LEAAIEACKPLVGKACGLHVAKYLREKGVTPSLVSEGDDGKCFHYAVASHFLGSSANEDSLKKFIENELKIPKGKECMPLDGIEEFEELNKEKDIAINVAYKEESGEIIPVRASKNIKAANNIVLLLFYSINEATKNGVLHYARVEEPDKLFATRFKDDNEKVMNTSKVFICWNCHNVMKTFGAYENHTSFCHENKSLKIIWPNKGDVVSFDSIEKTNAKSFRSAFMLHYDFEALQVDPERSCGCSDEVLANVKKRNCMTKEEKENEVFELRMLEGEVACEWESKVIDAEENDKKPPSQLAYPRRLTPPAVCEHKMKIMKNQPPFTYCYVLVDREGKVKEEKVYVGEDAAENFVISVINLADKYLPTLSPGKEMESLTKKEKSVLKQTTNCYLCGFHMDESERALDHDHLTGKFLGVAHNACNLKRREQVKLTCFAHNFTGYDSHFIVKSIHKYAHLAGRLTAIPLNTQKFKSIHLDKRIAFVDSCQFMLDSLENLVEAEKKSGGTFGIVNQLVSEPKEKELLLRKGVYPYSFATSIKKLKETTSLPPIEAFYNDLRQEQCSKEDYLHAQKVWETFECENMLDYTTLYVRADAYLLADVTTSFRNKIWTSFGLDMCQYLSLPHLAKDIMLKETKAENEIISDPEMSNLLQKNIRGGLSYVNVRHAKKVRRKRKTKENRTLIYLDANNLYGQSMRYPMPLHGFKWMTKDEILKFDPQKDVTLKDGIGYILEVDLEYPEELHLAHNSFPLAPESAILTWDDLSPYSKECLRVLRGKNKELV